MKKKGIFNYNRLLKPICELTTHHKYRHLIGWMEGFELNNFENPEKYDFHFKCDICGYCFFNHSITQEELEFIKGRSEYARKD